MSVVVAHHARACDWFNFTLATIPNPEWLLFCVGRDWLLPADTLCRFVHTICKRNFCLDYNDRQEEPKTELDRYRWRRQAEGKNSLKHNSWRRGGRGKLSDVHSDKDKYGFRRVAGSSRRCNSGGEKKKRMNFKFDRHHIWSRWTDLNFLPSRKMLSYQISGHLNLWLPYKYWHFVDFFYCVLCKKSVVVSSYYHSTIRVFIWPDMMF